jgi:hypothetical protein
MRATLISVLVLLACGGPQARGEADLSESIRQFNEGVRWERFSAAATSIPPPQRSHFVDEMDQRASDLKITDYEIVNVAPRGDREARVQIKLSWYRASEGTVHETHAIQTWERHGKSWLMVDETRLRGAEMPGLLESSWPSRPSQRDPFRSAAKHGSEAPCGEGPPCGDPTMKD